MGDAGEGLIDAESRIQERMDELARARTERHAGPVQDPDALRAVESLRLARADLERQMAATSHKARRKTLTAALADVDKRLKVARAALA